MKRFATLFTLAAVALAACQDNAPTGLRPSASPLAANGPDTDVEPGTTSNRGVIPLAFSGNTGKDANGSCATYGGTLTYKVDGANDKSGIYGYNFDVSNDGKYLSFTQTSPGYVIVAVLVKGGPAYDVYAYGNGNGPYPTDGNLSSPDNRGGNVPTISHYVVCAAPATPPTVEKKFIGAFTGTMERMIPVSFVTMAGTPCVASLPYGGCLPIDQYATLWIEYEVKYTSPLAGTITDNVAASCTALNTFHTAGNPYPGWPLPYYSTANFGCTTGGFFNNANPNGANPRTISAGNGTYYIYIDIKNNGYCGDRPYTNKVTLTAGAYTVQDTETVWIWPRGIAANGCNPNEGM